MEIIEVKTAELIGPALDWAVLFAGYGDGPDCRMIDGGLFIISLHDVRVGMDGIGQQEKIDPFQPSTRWQDGGPLIDSHVTAINKTGTHTWWAHSEDRIGEGETALIAACRAIVASKIGDTVNVPKELTQ